MGNVSCLFQSVQSNIVFGLILAVGVLCVVLPATAQDSREVPEFLRSPSSGDTVSITEVSVVNRDTDEITIRWETSASAYGRVYFGRDGSELSGRSVKMNAKSSRSVTFSNLMEGTRYRFRVEAWTSSETRTRSPIGTIQTRGTPPPRFKQFSVHERRRNGGIIRIRTNIPTRVNFRSGHDTSLKYSTTQENYSRYHEISLDHFYPDETVYYTAEITDRRGRTDTSGLRTFRTRENNVALRKEVTGTFDELPYEAPERMADDDMNARITDGDFSFQKGTATSGDPADTAQWFTVNVEELVSPDTAVLYWFGHAYPRSYEIHASKLGTNWDTLVVNRDAAQGESVGRAGIEVRKDVVSFGEIKEEYQFFRVRVPQHANYFSQYNEWDYVQILEFKLFPRRLEREHDPFQSGLKESSEQPALTAPFRGREGNS